MQVVYLISLPHGNPLIPMIVILGHRADRYRPTFHPGAGVTHIVGSAHTEGIALVRLAHKGRLGLGGMR
jgi:hypothetical protein